MTIYREAKLNPILDNLRKSVTEEVKRSDHPDFATSSELKQRDWSGVRLNSLTDTYEFWIAGSIAREVPLASVLNSPMLLEEVHVELFGIHSGRTR